MCGIAGMVAPSPQWVDPQKLKAAADLLQHRGPEQAGFYFNNTGTVGFAHRRLSIIDLSAEAAQPMTYMGRYHLVYNGELYNYLELRRQLEQRGFSFKSQSDTEVLLAAYAADGPDCLRQFDGMFAFAIWDEQEQTLFAARDRMGEKPFYYFYDGEKLLFASEIKALWSLGVPKQVNHAMLYNFIGIGYTANPADPTETFYNEVRKLPPAHYLLYHLPGRQLNSQLYWQPTAWAGAVPKEAEATAHFGWLLEQSVQKRLRSDVAIGTSLSGGLDSASIAAICSKFAGTKYTHACFTATFEGYEKDESAFARMVAGAFGLQHHTCTIEAGEVPVLMQQVAAAQDEPVLSASPLAQYKVYQLAKEKGVTVLLDGQGADELLAGYHKYYKWYWQELYRGRKLEASGELKAARSLGVKESFTVKNKMAALLPELTAALLQSQKARRAATHPHLNRSWAFAHKRQLYYSLPATPDLNGALYYNSFVYGLEELLRMADRNSMAHSVEVRLPFLAHQLVEFVFSLPPHYKIQKGWTKWILRNSMKTQLPEAIVWRKDKVGFEPPQQQWMQNTAVREAISEAKEKLVRQGILASRVLEQKIRPHDAHAAENRDWKYWSAALLFK